MYKQSYHHRHSSLIFLLKCKQLKIFNYCLSSHKNLHIHLYIHINVIIEVKND